MYYSLNVRIPWTKMNYNHFHTPKQGPRAGIKIGAAPSWLRLQGSFTLALALSKVLEIGSSWGWKFSPSSGYSKYFYLALAPENNFYSAPASAQVENFRWLWLSPKMGFCSGSGYFKRKRAKRCRERWEAEEPELKSKLWNQKLSRAAASNPANNFSELRLQQIIFSKLRLQ